MANDNSQRGPAIAPSSRHPPDRLETPLPGSRRSARNREFHYDALAPYISKETLELHHGKHHRAYVDNVNKLVKGTTLASLDLESLMMAAAPDPSLKTLLNNAAQAWNHAFFWRSLRPAGRRPTGAVAERIRVDFGSYERLVERLVVAAPRNSEADGRGWFST